MNDEESGDRGWQLIAEFADDQLAPRERDELESLLLADDKLLQDFVLYMELQSRVVWHARAQLDATEERIIPDTDDLLVSSASPIVASRLLQAWQTLFRPTPLSITVATLVIGLLVTAMYFVVVPTYLATPNRWQSDAALSYEIVARLTAVHEATWGRGQVGTQRGAHLVVGQRMELKEGLAEITYESGARVTLQGPVAFTVSGPNSATLSDGRLAMLVTAESRGFVVDTPVARVIDLGTEFGLAVDHQTDLELHVFQGEVAIERSQHKQQRQIVRAGQAVVVSVGGGTVSEKIADRNQFVSRLPTLENEYAPSTPYTELVLGHQPVLYYRMEPSHTDVLFDSARWAKHGVLRRSAVVESPFDAGIDGHSLLLRGRAGGDHGIVARYPAATNNQLSVVAWVYVDAHSPWGLIAANWGDRRVGQFHFGQYDAGGDLSVNVTQTSGASIYVREGGGNPLPLKTWQHVAFVVDGERVTLYRNGERVAEGACRGILAQSPVQALTIGCKSNDAGTAGSLGTLWHGRIDELAVFHRALSADTIRQLSRTPAPAKVQPDEP